MKRCCVNCFQDAVVREFIESLAAVGDCDYCGKPQVATGDIATVGDFVRRGLDRAYGDASNIDDPNYEYFRASSPACVLEEEAGIIATARDKDLPEDLLRTFGEGSSEQDYAWLISGYDSIARHCNFYVAYGVEDANCYTSAWENFKSRVMHNTRFFDIDESRQALIREISELFPQLEGALKIGTRVYRARLAEDWLPYDPLELQQSLGPPPVHRAQNNRMSPRGISYLYVSGDPETCVAEIQPNVGLEVWVARFAVLKDVKLLDLAKLPMIDIPSIFSADYNENLDWADHFLSAFLAEVSQPPGSKDDPLEYIPTQVLAEHIRAQGYQGIAYHSAQHPEGVNYTLFCSPETDPNFYYRPDRPIFHEWLRLEEVDTVQVTGMRLETTTSNTRSIDPTTLKPRSDPDDLPLPSRFGERG